MIDRADQKQRGAWYTPDGLVQRVVRAAVTPDFVERATRERGEPGPIRIVDPACGDGRFLVAAARRIGGLGGVVHAVGVDVDQEAVHASRAALDKTEEIVSFEVERADALTLDWAAAGWDGVDLVIGNPPFLSQMAASTTRGGSSGRGGGPYADAAVEFLSLATELISNEGRVALVLPQSILSAAMPRRHVLRSTSAPTSCGPGGRASASSMRTSTRARSSFSSACRPPEPESEPAPPGVTW